MARRVDASADPVRAPSRHRKAHVPARWELQLTALCVGYCLIEISLPGLMWGVLGIFVLLAVAFAFLLLGPIWVVRLVTTVMDDPHHLRWRTWKWLVQPALIGILLFASIYDLPLMARLKLSEGALVQSIHRLDESREVGGYVGLVWVEDMGPCPWGYLRFRDGEGEQFVTVRTGSTLMGTCGILYDPSGRDLRQFGELRIRPLYGPWWRWGLSF